MTALAPLLKINQKMDRMHVPYEVSENGIESLLNDLESFPLKADQQPFWLTMARLAELALLCAGHYADSAEFAAAGDLLVNPREIRIKSRLHGISFTKMRHGRVSDQLKRFNRSHFTDAALKETTTQIIKPALLPHFEARLSFSGFFKQSYLDSLTRRMERIAATLGFLMAFGIDSGEELYFRMKGIGSGQREFIEENLCRFDHRRFDEFGRQLRVLLVEGNFFKNPPAVQLAAKDCQIVC